MYDEKNRFRRSFANRSTDTSRVDLTFRYTSDHVRHIFQLINIFMNWSYSYCLKELRNLRKRTASAASGQCGYPPTNTKAIRIRLISNISFEFIYIVRKNKLLYKTRTLVTTITYCIYTELRFGNA